MGFMSSSVGTSSSYTVSSTDVYAFWHAPKGHPKASRRFTSWWDSYFSVALNALHASCHTAVESQSALTPLSAAHWTIQVKKPGSSCQVAAQQMAPHLPSSAALIFPSHSCNFRMVTQAAAFTISLLCNVSGWRTHRCSTMCAVPRSCSSSTTEPTRTARAMEALSFGFMTART